MIICVCNNVRDSDSDERKELIGTKCGRCMKNKLSDYLIPQTGGDDSVTEFFFATIETVDYQSTPILFIKKYVGVREDFSCDGFVFDRWTGVSKEIPIFVEDQKNSVMHTER